VNILREGIDVPLVDGILIMRRSLQQNSPMFTQIIGRGLRGPRSGGTEKCLVWHIT
jgi:superfamily II DNA or RNA helicase